MSLLVVSFFSSLSLALLFFTCFTFIHIFSLFPHKSLDQKNATRIGRFSYPVISIWHIMDLCFFFLQYFFFPLSLSCCYYYYYYYCTALFLFSLPLLLTSGLVVRGVSAEEIERWCDVRRNAIEQEIRAVKSRIWPSFPPFVSRIFLLCLSCTLRLKFCYSLSHLLQDFFLFFFALVVVAVSL